MLITGNTFLIQARSESDAPAEAAPPPDPSRYLAWLRQRTAHIDIRGLQVGSGRASRFPIGELYIPLTISSAWAGRAEDVSADSPERGLPERASGRVELREALRATRLVIVGDPGAGKTTLLRRVAYLLCQSMLEDQPTLVRETLGLPRPLFPIFLRVAELATHIVTTKNRPAGPTTDESPGWIPHFLATASEEADLGLNEEFFRERLEQGEVMLLLDGLDEAPTDRQRRAIAALLDRTTERYGQCRYVLTGRPAAFRDEQVLPGFTHVEIDPLEDEAIQTFLRRWCQALFPESDAEAERHLEQLLDALRSRVEIRRMARNPVMLTALAVVHWNEKRLPEQRADLYESIITWLSRSREQRPKRPTPERCVDLSQELALAMQDHADGRQTLVPRRWAAETLAPCWREVPEDRRLEQADRFLRDEELDSGIVIGRGDYVRFWHLTFQEYLAARALAARDDKQQRSVLLAQPKLYAPEWKEVVLLMAGVLYRHGVPRVDGMISSVLDTLGKHAQLADQALCLGVLGAAVRDLSPVNYQPSDPRYRQLLDDVMGIFEPDWLQSGARRRAGLWSRVIGLVVPSASQAALMRLAADAADVLGQAGVARYQPDELDKAWVTIPGGRFLMGAQAKDDREPNYDRKAFDWESPPHKVNLDEYRIARHPVTVAQFRRFVDEDGYTNESHWSGGGFGRFDKPADWDDQLQYPARPVVRVSWYEAPAYCVWAGVRLPTEAEWERAARGTEGRKFPWGSEPASPARMNYDGSGISHPTPVGIYPLGNTPEGICDMAGNVWEWCADWYAVYTHDSVSNPMGPESGGDRVFRGGCWANSARGCRPANRFRLEPDDRNLYLGFRVAPVPPGKA